MDNTVTVVVQETVVSVTQTAQNVSVVLGSTPDDFVSVTVLENIVEIAAPGPQGPPGPPGSGGGDSFYYLHTQSIPSTSWAVAHMLGAKPNVDVLIGGSTVSGVRVDHVDLNNLVVTINTAQVGEVICS